MLSGLLDGQGKEWYFYTKDREEADLWVKRVSVVRAVFATREKMMWLVQDHHTHQISYEFHNDEEINYDNACS